jgi:predicted RNA-binding Zn-ribbon protein involved in translation (DUF1610 family)
MAATRGRKWMRMKIPSRSKHTCVYCGMIWTVGYRIGGAACPRCGNKTLYESDYHQEIGIVSPSIVHFSEKIYRCPACSFVYTKEGACPRCGERVRG